MRGETRGDDDDDEGARASETARVRGQGGRKETLDGEGKGGLNRPPGELRDKARADKQEDLRCARRASKASARPCPC